MKALVIAFTLAGVLGLGFRSFIFSTYEVRGSVMEPNFHDGEIVLVWKFSFPKRSLSFKRGDPLIISLSSNSGEVNLFRRIVGLEGDLIEMQEGILWVNEAPVTKKGVELMARGGSYRVIVNEEEEFGKKIVTPGHVFVLADNRRKGEDSRSWGLIPIKDIQGRFLWRLKTARDAD